jgi:hypothetical protein
MIQYVKQILVGQFEASLAMLNNCVRQCPEEHWEGKIANGTFRWVAYHTLFFVDLYLSPNKEAFELRELHRRGGDEREPLPACGLPKEEILSYVKICRQKMRDALAAETRKSLEGPCGFRGRKLSRGELHIYNIRHIQHHTGQLSAFLRRVTGEGLEQGALPWISTGWR